MKLSIIIVSWNTVELTLKCLKSIFSCLGNDLTYEVFLVDNNSTDGTVEVVTQTFRSDNLYIIQNKENLGFAKANNQALRLVLSEAKDPVEKGESHYILLLNSDTELLCHSGLPARPAGGDQESRHLDPDFRRDDKSGLLHLVDFMDSRPEIGILGPKLLNTDGSLQRSCRHFPKLLDQLFIQLKFYNFWPDKIKSVREYFMLDFKHDEICEVDQVMGAAMLVRQEVFSALGAAPAGGQGSASGGDKIGLLDEKFWAIFEEVDFCRRAKNAGYKTYFYPDTQIIHHKESSFKQLANLRKQINFNQSLYHYFYKHKPKWQLFIFWLFQPINLFLTWLDSLVGVRKRVGKKKDL